MFDGSTRRTWIFQWGNNGNGATGDQSGGQWTVLSSTNVAPSARRFYEMASLGPGKVVLFGGYNGGQHLGDTWLFDLSNKEWASIGNSLSATAPSARKDFAMTSLGAGKVMLFGGFDGINQYLNDTWVFDDQSNKGWTLIGIPTNTKAPSSRASHAMALLREGIVVLFGGWDGSQELNDTWIFYQSTKTWATLTTQAPPPRDSHAMASLGTGKVVLFGGFDGSQLLGDTWVFNQSTTGWALIEASTNTKAPSPRADHHMTSLGAGKVALFGGWEYSQQHLFDTWEFDQNNKHWTQLYHPHPTIKSPQAREFHEMAPLEGGKLLMFGGYDDGHFFRDAWVFDPFMVDWALVDNPPTPKLLTARAQFAMASLGKGNVVLFGGWAQNGQYLNDTWVFHQSNKNWTAPTTHTPPPRGLHAMASLGEGKVVLFGGYNGNQQLGDTWIFDQSSGWASDAITPNSNTPSSRDGHAMALLEEGKVVMFGGKEGTHSNQVLGDTLVYDQSSKGWASIEIPPNMQAPSPRHGHAMSSMAAGKVVLFGGLDSGSQFLPDTWMYHRHSKTAWKWHLLTTQMASRAYHKMTSGLDSSIVLFGGRAKYQSGTKVTSTYGDDTWILPNGCAIGHGGTGCFACPIGKYSVDTNDNHCTSCPALTTTATTGATSRYECLVCAGTNTQTKNATCFVDLSGLKFTTKWTCIGTHGPRCATPCPGGAQSPCSNNGKCDSGPNATGTCTCRTGYFGFDCSQPCDCNTGECNDGASSDGNCTCKSGTYGSSCSKACLCNGGKCHDGISGSGNCTCNDGTYGPSCSETCKCNLLNAVNCNDGATGNGKCTECKPTFYGPLCHAQCNCSPYGGTCNDGVSGDGACSVCYPLFIGGGSNCVFPTLGVVLGFLVLVIVAVGFRYFQRFRKTRVQLHVAEENYGDLDLRHIETTRDNSQLQKAWIVKRADVTLDTVIGQGAFGEVWKGRWRGIDVAFKKMFPDEMMDLGQTVINPLVLSTPTAESASNRLNEVALAMLDNLEVGVMMRLRHPRLVAFLGAGEIIDPPVPGDDVPRVGIFVMLEYAAGGDLTHRLQAAIDGTKPFPFQDRIQCAMDIAEGMAFIHSEGVIHRDLKSLNVLLDKEGRCMIADLGLATSTREKYVASNGEVKVQVQEEEENLSIEHTSKKGTVAWMAPEVLNTNYDKSVDVFSFAVVMWELITGRIPWQGEYSWPQHILMAVRRGERPQATEEELANVPEGYVTLMNRCWARAPKSRPSFNVILMKLRQIKTGKHVRGIFHYNDFTEYYKKKSSL